MGQTERPPPSTAPRAMLVLRSCFITSIRSLAACAARGHETAAQAARLQQAHFMPASLTDSQASEGYEMRSSVPSQE